MAPSVQFPLSPPASPGFKGFSSESIEIPALTWPFANVRRPEKIGSPRICRFSLVLSLRANSTVPFTRYVIGSAVRPDIASS